MLAENRNEVCRLLRRSTIDCIRALPSEGKGHQFESCQVRPEILQLSGGLEATLEENADRTETRDRSETLSIAA
jgi:hypothetical protein